MAECNINRLLVLFISLLFFKTSSFAAAVADRVNACYDSSSGSISLKLSGGLIESSLKHSTVCSLLMFSSLISGSGRKYRKLCQKIETSVLNMGRFRSIQNSPNLDIENSKRGLVPNDEETGVESVTSSRVLHQINESIHNVKLKSPEG